VTGVTKKVLNNTENYQEATQYCHVQLSRGYSVLPCTIIKRLLSIAMHNSNCTKRVHAI